MSAIPATALAVMATVVLAVQPAGAQDPPANAAGADEPVLTLDEAIERALRASPAMANGEGAVETASLAERTAWGAFLPGLSATSGASLSSTERFNPQTNTTVSGSSDSYNAGLSASVDLFTGGRRTAQLSSARSETAAAEAALIEQRYATILAAKQSFFDVLRADELIRVAESRVRRAREGLAAAERRMSVGAATRSDVLRTTLELNQARQALLEAQTQRRTATFALGRTVGVDGPVGARRAEALDTGSLALTRDEVVRRAEAAAPSVRAAAATASAADAAIGSARSQYLPSLSLSGGSDWFNQDATLRGGRTSWSLRVRLSYPLFNGFSREEQVARARIQADVADTRLRDARLAARAEAERLIAALELAEQQLTLAQEAVEVAREDLRVQEERYRLGAGTVLDRITSQVALDEAEQSLVTARYDYHIARAELDALLGEEL